MSSLTTIAVIGATGTAGSRVVARLKARDVAVVEISRAHGVDLFDGDGLYLALRGVDVAIDVSNAVPHNPGSEIARAVVTAARNVVGACAAREVRRLVISTLACIDEEAFDGLPYYEDKRAAKDILLGGPVPTTIVRSTQWYESAINSEAVRCTDDEVIVEDWLIQPIAADTVADVLVEAALGQAHKPCTVTGPEAIRLPELASKLLSRRGDKRRVRASPPAVPALAAGALLAPDHAIVLGPGVETWLRRAAPAGVDGHAVDGSAVDGNAVDGHAVDGNEAQAKLSRSDFSRI